MSEMGQKATSACDRTTSALPLPAQPVDATLYLKGEMECALMGRRFHRGFTAAEKTEVWDRWKRGECCVDRLSRHLISGHAVDGTACQVCAISGSGRAHSINLFHPTHNPRPIFFKRPLSHKQSQMIARRDLVADIFRLRSYQPLHCKQLFRSNQ